MTLNHREISNSFAWRVGFDLPYEGPYRQLYDLFRSDKKFASAVRNGGATVVIQKDMPIIRVKVHSDGHTLWADQLSLYKEWLLGCTGNEYLKKW
jgi:hypothetical protein